MTRGRRRADRGALRRVLEKALDEREERGPRFARFERRPVDGPQLARGLHVQHAELLERREAVAASSLSAMTRTRTCVRRVDQEHGHVSAPPDRLLDLLPRSSGRPSLLAAHARPEQLRLFLSPLDASRDCSRRHRDSAHSPPPRQPQWRGLDARGFLLARGAARGLRAGVGEDRLSLDSSDAMSLVVSFEASGFSLEAPEGVPGRNVGGAILSKGSELQRSLPRPARHQERQEREGDEERAEGEEVRPSSRYPCPSAACPSGYSRCTSAAWRRDRRKNAGSASTSKMIPTAGPAG